MTLNPQAGITNSQVPVHAYAAALIEAPYEGMYWEVKEVRSGTWNVNYSFRVGNMSVKS